MAAFARPRGRIARFRTLHEEEQQKPSQKPARLAPHRGPSELRSGWYGFPRKTDEKTEHACGERADSYQSSYRDEQADAKKSMSGSAASECRKPFTFPSHLENHLFADEPPHNNNGAAFEAYHRRRNL